MSGSFWISAGAKEHGFQPLPNPRDFHPGTHLATALLKNITAEAGCRRRSPAGTWSPVPWESFSFKVTTAWTSITKGKETLKSGIHWATRQPISLLTYRNYSDRWGRRARAVWKKLETPNRMRATSRCKWGWSKITSASLRKAAREQFHFRFCIFRMKESILTEIFII